VTELRECLRKPVTKLGSARTTACLQRVGENQVQILRTEGCKNREVLLNSLNAELNSICHLLVLLGAHPILHISRIRVNRRKVEFW
jgi:hypothetical protein